MATFVIDHNKKTYAEVLGVLDFSRVLGTSASLSELLHEALYHLNWLKGKERFTIQIVIEEVCIFWGFCRTGSYYAVPLPEVVSTDIEVVSEVRPFTKPGYTEDRVANRNWRLTWQNYFLNEKTFEYFYQYALDNRLSFDTLPKDLRGYA